MYNNKVQICTSCHGWTLLNIFHTDLLLYTLLTAVKAVKATTWAPTRSFHSSNTPGRGGLRCSFFSSSSSCFFVVLVGDCAIFGFVFWTTDILACICPVVVASCLFRYVCTNLTVRPGHDAYALHSIAGIQVFWPGWPAALW